jgi:alkyldihydroxyacetonephosphate synthase
MVALRLGKTWRMPDAVARPQTEEEVAALVQLASPTDGELGGLCLVPFGGGTNVSLALRSPSLAEEPRPIVSVDLRGLARIRWLDEEHGLAEIEAGATGKQIQEALAGMGGGWTMGHEPDSFEFSTLGGWVATKASGMKRGRYGNIEDIVLGVSYEIY